MSSPSPEIASFTPEGDAPFGDHIDVPTDPSSEGRPPWQLIDLQDCLHDSPQFRRMLSMKEHELTELERKLEKVVTTCSTMVDSGQIFRENCRLFSLSLKELSDHFTELPSVQDAFSRFCEIFNEIQTYYRILFDQAQRTVMKGLKEFLTGDLRKVHNSQKSFHKTSAELNYVIHRNATASRQKPEADEMSSLLQTMQVEFTHQALDYCYQINVVSCLKGHRLTEKLVSFLGATSAFFHQGSDSLKQLDPYLRELAQGMERLQEQSSTDINCMRNRHSMVSSQHMQEDFSEMPTDNISMPIVFRGYLFKRSHNAFKSWNRRYCELRDSKLFYLKKNSEDEKGIIADDLRLCTVKLADDLERRNCFEVVTPSRSCMLQADSEMDRRKWCMYLEAGIARALRVTSSNKSREMRRRLTSSNVLTPQSTELSTDRLNSPSGIRADTPSSLNSNASGAFDFLDVPGNDCCADCSRPNPKWASLNIGILLCIDCSGIHRSLGVHISKVRSTTLDDWEPEHQKIMTLLGNDRVNSIYEFEVPSYVKKPTATTSSSDREEYIRMKYVSRAFVHPHPDFDRPKVPVPPPRIQSTLLRAVATSPKLAGRLNRPVSMTTGVVEHHLSPSASPLPTHSPSLHHIQHSVNSGDSSPFGGLNLRPESMALLEENWKKLEKNGRLQQWNLKSMYNVVKSPRKSFNLSKFARPGSFRRKKSPLVTDDYPHSDNELDDPQPPSLLYHSEGAQSQSVSPNLAYAPRKPPRTYTTTVTQIESYRNVSGSLFNSDSDDFSSDLLSTLDRLGSVYSISGLLREEMDGNHDNDATIAGENGHKSHRKLLRSVSVQLESENRTNIPKIAVLPNTAAEGAERIIEEEESNPTIATTLLTTASREVSKSLTCLDGNSVNHNDEVEELVLNYDEEPINYTDDIRDRTLRNVNLSEFIDDDSSVDSYQSAEDRNDLIAREDNSRPDSPIETIKRPDSEASELFHTPPNSISPCPSGLEAISPSDLTNIGLALGVKITLEDSTSTSAKSPGNTCHGNLGDLSDIGGELCNVQVENDHEDDEFGEESINVVPPNSNKDEATTSSNTEEPSGIGEKDKNDTPPSENMVPNDTLPSESMVQNDTPPSENVSSDVTLPPSLTESPMEANIDYDDTSSGAVFHGEGEDEVDPYLEYEIHIIPDEISPSKFLFECSLNGDLGGILSGIAHGGVINQSHTEEGNKYPIHQACITGNETAVEFLYQNGAKLNVTDDRGCTSLHLASINGYVSLVATLLKRGADYTIVNNEGKTPEMYATDRKNGDIVAILKLAKADKDLESVDDEDSKMILEESVAAILCKESTELDSIKSRSLSSTNSSSSTDKGGSELSISTTGSNSVKTSGLLNSKSKLNT